MPTPALRLTNTDSDARAPRLGCFKPQAALTNIPHHGALFDVDARRVHPACDPGHR